MQVLEVSILNHKKFKNIILFVDGLKHSYTSKNKKEKYLL